MELSKRDIAVFREIERWRFCLGRHIQFLAGFSSQRTCDRRLSKLLNEGFLTRRIVIYGVPSVYLLTRKSKTLIFANQRQEQIRLDQIMHDITVLDIAVCFMKFLGLEPKDIKTEKQLHQENGFGERSHHPDFIFTKDNKTYCVEVELSLKSKARLEKNIKSNFLKYHIQIWVTDENGTKLIRILEGFKTQYPNMEITNLTEVKNNVFRFNI
ncbi:MAG: hypothetical protein LBS36_00535 [Oscillospiraceae bacterium]|jgi:hypothetical protein|nr:hypothetical protein [Oscillospiraceae bacterium]